VPIDLELDGRVCIVTGGTRGIGREVVTLLLEEGAQVLAAGRRAQTVEALREDLARYGDRLSVTGQNMQLPDAGEALVATAISRFGTLDVVVNNAAGFEYKAAEDVDREDWSTLFELKALGYLSLATAAIPRMTERGGAITNVAGVAGVRPSPTSVHVGAVNAAVISMSESLALGLASRHIRVNVVSPGVTDTDRFQSRIQTVTQAGSHTQEGAREVLSADIPIGIPADPKEVARAIVVVSSPVMRSLTGSHLIVDGGSTLERRRRA
jgi:NAD(P)-dependent dehydrogenase (short-subunit alcohol dehydrogenase family)